MMMNINIKDKVGLIFKWTINAFWPVIVFVLGGGMYFSDSVIASIKSTTDPVVVYAIIGTVFLAIGLLFYAMHKYILELFFLEKIADEVRTKKQLVLGVDAEKSIWFAVYHLITLDLPWGTVKPVLELEIEKARESFHGLIQFPTYLAGALVGMGLVGTFIGLLATLKDLAEVFALMANMGNSGGDPIRMFGDMIVKLQGPIKGMGTAFVASLYGLMGSLIVGMVVLSVKRFGERVSLNIERFSEEYLSQKMQGSQVAQTTQTALGASEATMTALANTLVENMGALNDRLAGLNLQLKSYELEVANIAHSIAKVGTLKLRSEKVLVYGALIALLLLWLGTTVFCINVFRQSSVSSVAVVDYGNPVLEKPTTPEQGKSKSEKPALEKPTSEKPETGSAQQDALKKRESSSAVTSNAQALAHSRKIVKGDTLTAIAKLCGSDVAKLLELNARYRPNPHKLSVDEVLVVPSAQCANNGPEN